LTPQFLHEGTLQALAMRSTAGTHGPFHERGLDWISLRKIPSEFSSRHRDWSGKGAEGHGEGEQSNEGVLEHDERGIMDIV